MDKQHAVINYNPTTDEHLVKDLGSLNGVRHKHTHISHYRIKPISSLGEESGSVEGQKSLKEHIQSKLTSRFTKF